LVFSAYLPARVNDVSFLDLPTAKETWSHNIIAISNQKGGVAKTSTCLNLGTSLSILGKKVLLIDFDVQANLTLSMGFKEVGSFYDALGQSNRDLQSIVIRTGYDNLWLLPSDHRMVMVNKKYFGVQHYEFILKDRLNRIKNNYDYILIDTPPSIDFFTLNALTAASLAVIPSQCDVLSTLGVEKIQGIISMIQQRTNPSIEVRVLINMYDDSSRAARLVHHQIRERYKEKAFDTIIEQDDAIKEAQILSLPVIHYKNQSRASLQYLNLAKEILNVKHSKNIERKAG
jgi:chromosome partitioning protein